MGGSMTEGIFLARPELPAGGVRLAVKDLFDTAGLATTYGSAVFADHIPAATAEAVRRAEAAGYASVGKTNLHEFAYGVTSQNPHFGTVPNPVAPGRTAGGSSGGSAAALAAGLADAALGTDSGGSIRIPAACCAVVGFKPSYGVVPLDGCFPLAPSFDHAGPMARSVAECVSLLAVLAPDFVPQRLESLEEVTAGVAWLELADPGVARRVDEAARTFPRRRRLELPLPHDVGPAFMREVADVHRELYAEFAELYGANVRAKIERCLDVTDREYDAAVRRRDEYRAQWGELVEDVDVVVTPTLPVVPPPADGDELELRATLIRFTFPFNALGWPALALPCGPADGGLPASAQLAAPAGADALVVAAGKLLERALSPRATTGASHRPRRD
ncbi:MAG: amidase [Thermoleophilia bacterium]|nr:amidase [Thermoleophilia bacterium]